MTTLRLAVALAAALGLAACESYVSAPGKGVEAGGAPTAQTPRTDPLDGTSWTLTAIDGKPIMRPASGTTLRISADGDGASGDGPCNLYNADVDVAGDALRFGRIVATERACFPETRMAAEARYFAALGRVARFDNVGGVLTLFDAAGAELLRYEAATPMVEEDLIGTRWTLGDLEGTPAAGLAFLAFDANGELSGQAPCNTLGGDYRLGAGRTVEIMAQILTRCYCDDFEIEKQFMDALSRVERWRIDGERLLLEGGGATLMILERARSAPEPKRGC